MNRGVSKVIWLVTMFMVASSAFSQVEIDDAIVEKFWTQWANKKDVNGKAGTHFDEKLPGYVYNYQLAEDVSIPSKDDAEEANSKNKDGAIVLMVPTGQPDEMAPGMEYAVSTDEALGYGMMLAVMYDDQDLFNRFLRVVNYFDDDKEPKLTSWVIPAKKGESLKTGVYADLEKELKEHEKKSNFVEWVGGFPADFNSWSIKFAPKYVDDKKTIEGVNKVVNGKKTIAGYAMDGELDIAFALLMAHDKWVLKGNSKYKYLELGAERYKAILDDVIEHGKHVNPNKSEKFFLPTGPYKYNNKKYIEYKVKKDNPNASKEELKKLTDDALKKDYKVFDGTRPCDWMLSHFRAYYEISGDVNTRELIGSIQEQMKHFESTDGDGLNDTGLVPEFAFYEDKISGTEKLVPVKGLEQIYTVGETNAGDYYMNSARYTARLAMDYLLYKDEYSLDKAIDIIEFLGKQDKPFRPARNIETGEIPAKKYDTETWELVDSGFDTWDNRILRACLLMAAGANPDNETLSAFYEKYKNEPDPLKGWNDYYYGTIFGSQYPTYKHYVGWKASNKSETQWTAFPKLGADPGVTEYFNDTWVLLTLGALNKDLYRPHAFPNELTEDEVTWEITAGNDCATIDHNTDTGVVTVTINKVPASDDPYAITIGTDDFKCWAGMGYAFDMLLERKNMNGASSMEARQSYPGLEGAKIVKLNEIKLASDIENKKMHYMGCFGPAKKGAPKENKPSKLEIGINSGIKVGSVLVFSDFGLFDPPNDAAKYRYVGPWKSDKSYEVGDYVRYNMETYQCVKAHQATPGSHPAGAPSLWKLSDYTLIGAEWESSSFYYRGDLVHYQGRTYMAKVSFTSVNPPPEAEAVWMLYHDPFVGYAQDWFRGGYYREGDYTLFNGNAYICKSNHKSIPGWNPETAWTLWEKANYLFIEIDPQPWESWTPYKAGAVVVYNDVKYECVIGHTAQPGWEPNAVGAIWKEYK